MTHSSGQASTPALETYLAGVDPGAAPLVIALDDAITTAHPGFDVAIKYGLLMYALERDWRTWVCAIGTTRRGVSLRFLYGVLFDDPLGVLRAGSSVLKSWDFAAGEPVDRTAVGGYVAEAVARHAFYKANSAEILASARAAARGSRPPAPDS